MSEEAKHARDYLEEKDPTTLTGEEHVALALYYIGDVLLDVPEDDDD